MGLGRAFEKNSRDVIWERIEEGTMWRPLIGQYIGN